MSFYPLIYLAMIGLFINVIYRIIDGWVSRLIQVREEQNDALHEIAEALRIKEPKANE